MSTSVATKRPAALDEQLLTHLRTDHFGALQLRAGVDGLEDLEDPRADLVAFRIRIGRQAHQDVARAAEGLHLRRGHSPLGQSAAQLLDVRRLREIRLDHHAAGEVDAQIQAAHHHQGQRRR